jgi:hypothetical protein
MLTGVALAVAWVRSVGGVGTFSPRGVGGTQPMESNSHGKFWYSGPPFFVTHLNISAATGGATQNIGTNPSKTSIQRHFSRIEWFT